MVPTIKLLFLLVIIAATACTKGGLASATGGPEVGGSDTDTDILDTGTSTDADSDADTDTDTDADNDSDTDTDTDSDTDADNDSDTDTDTDTDTDADTDADTDTDADSDADADTDTDTDTTTTTGDGMMTISGTVTIKGTAIASTVAMADGTLCVVVADGCPGPAMNNSRNGYWDASFTAKDIHMDRSAGTALDFIIIVPKTYLPALGCDLGSPAGSDCYWITAYVQNNGQDCGYQPTTGEPITYWAALGSPLIGCAPFEGGEDVGGLEAALNFKVQTELLGDWPWVD